MKRTAEIIFSVLGILVYGIVALIGILVVWVQNNQAKMESILIESGSEDLIEDFYSAMESIGSSGLLMVMFSIAAAIAGIVAIVLVKGNKNPKAAGITLVATAVVVTILSFGIGILGGVFYLIGGILCLVRKDTSNLLAG